MMISTLVRFFIDPFHIFLFLLAGVVLAYLFKQQRSVKILLGLTSLWFFVITTPFVPYTLLYSLESRYSPLDIDEVKNESEVHIIVLGAGYIYNEDLPATVQLNREMLSRLIEGVRIKLKLPNSILIVSGPYNHDTHSQADVAKQAAVLLGVPGSTIKTQHEGLTTHQEAEVYYRRFYNGQKTIVVTSASHMHRALSEFRRLGIQAIPSPSSFRYRSEKGMRISFWPSLSNIYNMKAGIFEYAAILRNYMRDSFR